MNTICDKQVKVIWLTGLSGSGKSTIAEGLKELMLKLGEPVYILDGDVMRRGLNRDLGYDDHSRSENIRRAIEVARILHDAHVNVIAAFISPFQKDRDLARSRFSSASFIEAYLSTPLEVCERRDAKDLYKRARQGVVKNMTGIDSVYEPPLNPEITIDTSKINITESIRLLNDYIRQ
jgi:adenylyl-sulfate kinase